MPINSSTLTPDSDRFLLELKDFQSNDNVMTEPSKTKTPVEPALHFFSDFED